MTIPESRQTDERLDEETERLIAKLVDRAYWEGRNESTSPAINERVQEKYDALRSRIRELVDEARRFGLPKDAYSLDLPEDHGA